MVRCEHFTGSGADLFVVRTKDESFSDATDYERIEFRWELRDIADEKYVILEFVETLEEDGMAACLWMFQNVDTEMWQSHFRIWTGER